MILQPNTFSIEPNLILYVSSFLWMNKRSRKRGLISTPDTSLFGAKTADMTRQYISASEPLLVLIYV